MLKLPVCPYCNTVYRYKEVYLLKGSEYNCYHCKKKFRISRIGRIIPIIIIAAVLVGVNLFIFHTSKDLNLVPVVIIDVLGIMAAFVMFPLTVRFIPEKNDRR